MPLVFMIGDSHVANLATTASAIVESEFPGATFESRSFPGIETHEFDSQGKMREAVREKNPDILVVVLGTNDLGFRPADHAAHVRSIIAQAAGKPLIWWSPPYFTNRADLRTHADAIIPVQRAAVEAAGGKYIDSRLFTRGVAYQPGGIHPLQAGYRQWANGASRLSIEVMQGAESPVFADVAPTPPVPEAETVRGIPVKYLAVLARNESNMDPSAVNTPRGWTRDRALRAGRATGLFQITGVALADYNRRNGTTLRMRNLLDPLVNTRVAIDHLAYIIRDWAEDLPQSLTMDWRTPRMVELLTLGWNAGHVDVRNVAAILQRRGVPPDRITVDTVGAASRGYAHEAGRQNFAKKVAADYFGIPYAPSVRELARGRATTVIALLVLLGGAAITFVSLPAKEEEES